MNKILLILIIISGSIVWWFVSSKGPTDSVQQTTPVSSDFNLTEVSPGVHLHQGKHVDFEHEDSGDIANIGFIIGEDCVAVIDTSGSIKIARQLKESLLTITDKPVCYVINTHVHFDHLLGNIIFQSDKTEFVGHVNLFGSIESSRDFFLTEFAEELGEYANEEGLVAPTILVEDSMTLDLGNRELDLFAYKAAHSDTDLIVIDKQTKTAWLGDLLFVERIPALDGSLRGWISVIEELEAMDFEQAIPGHGPVVSWPEGIQAEKEYLNFLLINIRNNLEQGAFMEDVIETVGQEEKLKWLLHEQHHKRNVTKAFSELEWE